MDRWSEADHSDLTSFNNSYISTPVKVKHNSIASFYFCFPTHQHPLAPLTIKRLRFATRLHTRRIKSFWYEDSDVISQCFRIKDPGGDTWFRSNSTPHFSFIQQRLLSYSLTPHATFSTLRSLSFCKIIPDQRPIKGTLIIVP